MALTLVTPAEKTKGEKPLSFPSDRDLRRELADAIADRAAADGRARVARDVFDKADAARREAADHVARLRADMDAIRRAATERAAQGFTDALRAGSDLPANRHRPPITPPW